MNSNTITNHTKDHNVTCPIKPHFSNGAHLLEGRKYSCPNTWWNGIKVRENMLPFTSIQSKKYPCKLMTLFIWLHHNGPLGVMPTNLVPAHHLTHFNCSQKFGERLHSWIRRTYRDYKQCSRLKSSMPFNHDLALQNIPLKTTLQNATPNWKGRRHLKSSM